MLLARPISYTQSSTQYMDFVDIFNVSLDLSTIYFAHLVGVELLLCIPGDLKNILPFDQAQNAQQRRNFQKQNLFGLPVS